MCVEERQRRTQTHTHTLTFPGNIENPASVLLLNRANSAGVVSNLSDIEFNVSPSITMYGMPCSGLTCDMCDCWDIWNG